jgi:hypothetical protein
LRNDFSNQRQTSLKASASAKIKYPKIYGTFLRRNILYQSLARDHDKKSKDPN